MHWIHVPRFVETFQNVLGFLVQLYTLNMMMVIVVKMEKKWKGTNAFSTKIALKLKRPNLDLYQVKRIV